MRFSNPDNVAVRCESFKSRVEACHLSMRGMFAIRLLNGVFFCITIRFEPVWNTRFEPKLGKSFEVADRDMAEEQYL